MNTNLSLNTENRDKSIAVCLDPSPELDLDRDLDFDPDLCLGPDLETVANLDFIPCLAL